ncbi:prokaryotic E2 ligase family D protein [Dysgonomonas sp. GY75]|uniref:prokaryotic E2 ligase family D protein n=1 Tax=Dysgonomonas sp. GY75 TaxID=2780419 RepID=UPI001883B5DB|nr:prokaryotic E2 ligase family D protein [Dysgonomonas sp. GY75]MBF0648194.1 prokaryotic E2 ligase family D protein [Dysgonomonas sp. GY75]
MNKLTEQLKSLYRPKAVLIAYQGENARASEYFLELRQIDKNGAMGEAIPVTYSFMNDIAANFSEAYSGIPSGRLPENLLFADTRKGHEKYIWWNPPRKRMMYFVRNLGIENAEYHVPGIIYIAGESGLSVYAYKDIKLPEGTELFRAPFFNTSGDNVCLGTAKLQKPANPAFHELLEYWEKKFWLTEFSHLGGGGNPTKSNLVLVTKAAKDKEFDTDELKPLNKKLKDILK